MKHKKRAWNMTNPLYRYLHGKGKKHKAKARRVSHKRYRSVVSMARRSKRVSHRRGMFGGSGLMGLVKPALEGVGTATVVNQLTGGEKIPFQSEVAGAAGAYLMHRSIKSAAIGAGAVLLLKYLPNLMGGVSATSSNNAYGY